MCTNDVSCTPGYFVQTLFGNFFLLISQQNLKHKKGLTHFPEGFGWQQNLVFLKVFQACSFVNIVLF